MPTPVEETINIGEVLAGRLRAVGIETQEELVKVGDTAAFARIRKTLPDDACVSTRLALAGAVRGVRWFGLDKKLRTKLSAEARG
jgi:DNA transformation protein and related proteins